MIDIAWNSFTPWTALTGGALVGLAAASFLLLNGRIAGISGILGGLLTASAGNIGWGIAGICPGPGLVALGAGEVKATVFVASMVAGMGIFELVERKRAAFRSDDSGERWHYKAPE